MASKSKLSAPSSILEMVQDLKKVEKPTPRSHLVFGFDDEDKALQKSSSESAIKNNSISKSIINLLNGPKASVNRLAFEVDPNLNTDHLGLYKAKVRLIPDPVLKRIVKQDDLVAAIIQVRGNQIGIHGRPRPDRHANGFVIEANPGVVDKLTPEQKEELDKRIESAVKLFSTCGYTKGWSEEEKCSLSTFLKVETRDALSVGRIAVEIIYAQNEIGGGSEFHSFRPVDAGTIYRSTNDDQGIDNLREKAYRVLERLKNEKITPEKFKNRDYSWIQVINGEPFQGFTAKELLVHNFYPVTDIEMNGYPVTPIDTMIDAVMTHINITSHNKMYFQTGRATRGMLVIKSEEVDEAVIASVKQQFNASINSVANAWRMPVFGIGVNDEITWSAIDTGARDMEFQYLMDCNARSIFSAFQMSPEEVSGWSYLSRGTNNQALSESNNEFKLEAARDAGVRPLLADFEDFLNSGIFPLIDLELSKKCRIKLVGLEADTPEKESVRLQQDAPLHMTMDQILQKVEKKAIGKEFGGEFLLNPQFHEILDQHFTVGEIEERFMGRKDASKDPQLAYRRDPFWFQFQQLQQAAQQAGQQAQQQAAQQQAGGDGGANPGAQQTEAAGVSDEASAGGNAPMDAETNKQKSDKAKVASGSDTAPTINTGDTGEDLTRSIDQAIGVLTKGEQQLPPSKRRILAHHKEVLKQAMDGWEADLREATKEILDVAEAHTNKHSKK